MRRAIALLLGAAALVATWALLTGAGEDSSGTEVSYTIELDNAFGLIEGADVKVAGVRAGRIDDMRLNEDEMRALVDVTLDREGFGDLRADATCETRPQSLIGEYFIDCAPGKARERLEPGTTIPVERTSSTIPVDLVNNIMRRPYRERMSIILAELGAGLAARGDDLNETIRRASPALRETDRVLAILREQRRTIRDLYRDADRVLSRLADGREDVTRFVAEARDTARVGAARPAALRRQIRALPQFLAEASETMPLLATAAGRQRRALTDLQGNATLLRTFLDRLGPFADASRPALRTLGRAAERGQKALPNLRPRLQELAIPARDLPEITKNAAITLEHLDDRGFAVEKDPRSPGGEGLTGLEAFLRYVHMQSQAINLTDGRNYLLKVAPFVDPGCGLGTRDADTAKEASNERCKAWLGPNQTGITVPDPTKTDEAAPAKARKRTTSEPRKDAPAAAPQAPAAPEQPAAPQQERPKGIVPQVQQLLDGLLGPGSDLRKGLDGILGNGKDGGGLLGGLLGGARREASPRATEQLLNFLMAP